MDFKETQKHTVDVISPGPLRPVMVKRWNGEALPSWSEAGNAPVTAREFEEIEFYVEPVRLFGGPYRPGCDTSKYKNGQPYEAKMILGPDLCRWLIEHRRGANRNYIHRALEQYKEDMKSGLWGEFSGTAVMFSPDGLLLNGQHRVRAAAEIGVDLHTMVRFNATHRERVKADTGRRRTPAETLRMDEVPNAQRVATLARNVMISSRGGLLSIWSSKTIPPSAIAISHNVDVHEAEYQNALVPGNTRPAPRALIDLANFLFRRQSTDLAEKFMTDLMVGDNLPNDSPIFQLRNRLYASKYSRAKLPEHEQMCLILKAWKLFKQGATCKVLRYVDGEPLSELAEPIL